MNARETLDRLCEVRQLRTLDQHKGYVPPSDEPLRDAQTVRVYHGFNDVAHAVEAATHGLSGKERVPRRYSYEGDNNPTGLFVSADFNAAKEFSAAYGPAVIIEFHARVSDLEAPVWPGGSYTVQGGYAEYFGGDVDKREQARSQAREKASQAREPGVAKSDRPEVADLLMNSREFQALFVGDLAPNGIRAFWVRDVDPESGYQLTNKPFRRLSRTEFLQQYGHHASKKGNRHTFKVFGARDDWDPEKFLSKLEKENRMSRADIIDTFKHGVTDDRSLSTYLWPRQVPGYKAWMAEQP